MSKFKDKTDVKERHRVVKVLSCRAKRGKVVYKALSGVSFQGLQHEELQPDKVTLEDIEPPEEPDIITPDTLDQRKGDDYTITVTRNASFIQVRSRPEIMRRPSRIQKNSNYMYDNANRNVNAIDDYSDSGSTYEGSLESYKSSENENDAFLVNSDPHFRSNSKERSLSLSSQDMPFGASSSERGSSNSTSPELPAANVSTIHINNLNEAKKEDVTKAKGKVEDVKYPPPVAPKPKLQQQENKGKLIYLQVL